MRALESWESSISETVLLSLGLEGQAEFKVIDMWGIEIDHIFEYILWM